MTCAHPTTFATPTGSDFTAPVCAETVTCRKLRVRPMKLKKARVQNYWSIHDTGWFNLEDDKTVIVGPNEAGKTAVLRALQTVNMPPGRGVELNPLRDYPRSRYREIDDGTIQLSDVVVATAAFTSKTTTGYYSASTRRNLETATELYLSRYYDGARKYWFGDLEMWTPYADIEKALDGLRAALPTAKPRAKPPKPPRRGLRLRPQWTVRRAPRRPRPPTQRRHLSRRDAGGGSVRASARG